MSEKSPKKDRSKPRSKSLEQGVMEGKYVIVGYEAEDEFESINTILIYKIVNGKAEPIFGVNNFPEYQNISDPTLIDLILKKIKDLGITEVYQLTNLQDENYQFLDKSNFFEIELGSGDTGKVNEKDEVEDWWEISPWIKSDDVLSDLRNNEVEIKSFDVKKQTIVE